MKKAILCLIAAVSLLLPVSAVAAPTETGVSAQEASVQEASAADSSLPVPISVERKNIDGVEYLVKVYDLPADTPQEQLVEEDFVLEDFLFSYIAADVLPNTPGTEFTVENAYAADGQTLDYTADPNDSRNSSNKSWTDKASDVVNDVKDQASSLWDKITDSFSGLFR